MTLCRLCPPVWDGDNAASTEYKAALLALLGVLSTAAEAIVGSTSATVQGGGLPALRVRGAELVAALRTAGGASVATPTKRAAGRGRKRSRGQEGEEEQKEEEVGEQQVLRTPAPSNGKKDKKSSKSSGKKKKAKSAKKSAKKKQRKQV